MRPSSDIPAIEARAWFSPSTQRYFVQRWTDRVDAVDVWITEEGQNPGYPQVAITLPDDAFEIGANPTEWAYLRACEALHAHADRALAAEGRIERMRQHIMRTLGARNLPLESLIDLLLARVGGEPVEATDPTGKVLQRRPNFDRALARLTEIAGERADMSSTWATVQGALTVAASGRDTGLFREVIELSAVVRVKLDENERKPSWLTSS